MLNGQKDHCSWQLPFSITGPIPCPRFPQSVGQMHRPTTIDHWPRDRPQERRYLMVSLRTMPELPVNRCLSVLCVCASKIYDFLSIVFNAFIGCSKWTAGSDDFVDLIALAICRTDQLGAGAAPPAKSCSAPAVVEIRGTDPVAIHQPVLQVRRKGLVHWHTLKSKRQDYYYRFPVTSASRESKLDYLPDDQNINKYT